MHPGSGVLVFVIWEIEMKENVLWHIYGITNNCNNKIYIGQTRQGYLKRFEQHLQKSSGCPLLKKAIEKHGKQNFVCELLDTAYSQEEADEKEKMWICCLKTYQKENGYNLSLGGNIGHFNDDTLKKMSENRKGENNSFFNKKHTNEAKKKMSEWKKEHYKLDKHPRAKKVMCVETKTIYSCVKIASIETNINRTHINDVANKKYGRKTAGGYHWEWIK